MATHSSILAWTIPWTEEPGGLQSMELKRVKHNWGTEHTHLWSLHAESFFPFSFLLFYFAPFIPKCIAPEHFFNTDAIFLPSGPADEQQSYNQTIGNWQAQSMYTWLLSPQWFAVFSSYKPGPLRNTFSLKGNTTLLSEWHSISFPLAVFLSSHSHLLFPIHVVHSPWNKC